MINFQDLILVIRIWVLNKTIKGTIKDYLVLTFIYLLFLVVWPKNLLVFWSPFIMLAPHDNEKSEYNKHKANQQNTTPWYWNYIKPLLKFVELSAITIISPQFTSRISKYWAIIKLSSHDGDIKHSMCVLLPPIPICS